MIKNKIIEIPFLEDIDPSDVTAVAEALKLKFGGPYINTVFISKDGELWMLYGCGPFYTNRICVLPEASEFVSKETYDELNKAVKEAEIRNAERMGKAIQEIESLQIRLDDLRERTDGQIDKSLLLEIISASHGKTLKS